MTDRAILEAVTVYHASTTPDAVQKTERELAEQGVLKTEDQILWSAKMAFLDALDAIERESNNDR